MDLPDRPPVLPPPPPQTWRFPGDEAPPARQFTRQAIRFIPRALARMAGVLGTIAVRALVALIIMLLVAIPLLYWLWVGMKQAAGN
jgi:hypothetical protein